MRDTVCRSGDSHYAGCACHEARWTEKLAASEASQHAATTRLVEQEYAVAEVRAGFLAEIEALVARLAASEARVRALEEALRRCSSAAGHYDAATGCRAVIAIVGIALAPPPEAAKKGGE